MSNNIYQQLSEPFAPEMEKILVKSGVSLTYIPISEVVNRLNKVLGVARWDFTIISCQRDAIDSDFITAHVRLTWNPENAKEDDKWVEPVTKDGIGGQKIKRNKKGEIVDLGDEMKGAVSDALKKAAQMLGVGLYLARSDEAMDIEEAMESTQQAQSDPEVEQKWDNFVSIVKNLSASQKASLNDFWVTAGKGEPKPTKATATHESIDLLLAEAVRLSFQSKEAE
jgi:hypothetical protein